VERFQLGVAPQRWDGFLSKVQGDRGAVAIAEKAGLVASRQTGDGHYDRFRGRLVFPIHDTSGRVVGFGGRSLGDATPKYLNTPETPIFRKGRVFFGLPLALDAIRGKGRAILVEGYFDVLALKRAGLDECIAPCGTALTPDHARVLRRYAREVILLFDGDEAGQQAAQRALPVLSAEGVRVRASFLPSGEDPDTLLASQGEEALRACVESAVPLIEHLIEQNLTRPEAPAWEAADAARELAPILAVVSDPIERASYVREIARRLELPLAAIELALRRGEPRSTAPPPTAAAPESPVALEMDPLVRTLLGGVLSHPGLLRLVSGFPDEAWPTGPAGTLLSTVFAALEEHGDRTVARLLSPTADELPPELKRSLAEVAAEADPASPAEAERAVRDCLVKLKLRALDRETRDLTIRLKSCTDSAEQELLLERKQQILARMTEARSHADHV
jgi:DNA primase